MIFDETIVAQATPKGRSGVGIIRISGPHTKEVAMSVLKKIPLVRYATFSSFFDYNGKILDKGIAIFFASPNSFTGEDVLELQGHGSPFVLDLLMKNILLIPNLRVAHPGEFSQRAFLNGRLDLVQAEAISDLINSTSERAVKLSCDSLQGKFSKYIKECLNRIIELRSIIELMINFSEMEKDSEQTNFDIDSKLNFLYEKINYLKKSFYLRNFLRRGIKVIIVGEPNVGKSSLFNSLCNQENAIVTNIAGTTRDVLRADLHINGFFFSLIDTAGFRVPTNEVEKIGIDLAWKEIVTSDQIIYMFDGTINKKKQYLLYKNLSNKFSKSSQIIIVVNKCDLFLKNKKFFLKMKNDNVSVLYISAKKGIGLDSLKKRLIENLKISNWDMSEDIFLVRNRHISILKKTIIFFKKLTKKWNSFKNIELLAQDLFDVQTLLGEITGVFTTEDLLKKIFSSFCIGK
ncbi:MAG TPA: tRNA uridine-5-carboxymethylaminomethyl(34) synthesis GTPase MnmE [Buchnera sp. (in: enterobacteria)]|nr:tRNA uridine-5-carboxymethylaminomethyl(34) synthesis GTPase MnmE [Buchnera sp. (in: enterobacteria)]